MRHFTKIIAPHLKFDSMTDKDKENDPIAELQKILDDAGPDVAGLFGAALTIFAGASAGSKDEKEKLRELERLIARE